MNSQHAPIADAGNADFFAAMANPEIQSLARQITAAQCELAQIVSPEILVMQSARGLEEDEDIITGLKYALSLAAQNLNLARKLRAEVAVVLGGSNEAN
jgi:hypothetical protein